MPWYYVRGQERIGPVDEQQFSALVADGTITPDTHVWRDGMGNWQRLSEINYQAQSAAEPTAQPVSANPVCAECGKAFPADEMLRYGNQWVCAGCKPVFFQRVKEGVLPGTFRYGGFWIRLGALFLDGLILGLPMMIVFGAITFKMMSASSENGSGAEAEFVAVMNGFQWLATLIAIAYETLFVGRFGATPGKMACGLKVVRPDGSRVTYLRAFARYWAKQLSGIILGIAPYDIAASVLIAEEAGAVVTDAYGHSLNDVQLLDSSEANHRSLIAAANKELHEKLMSFFDTRINQFEQLLKRRSQMVS